VYLSLGSLAAAVVVVVAVAADAASGAIAVPICLEHGMPFFASPRHS